MVYNFSGMVTITLLLGMAYNFVASTVKVKLVDQSEAPLTAQSPPGRSSHFLVPC